jgi:hypothetical protein
MSVRNDEIWQQSSPNEKNFTSLAMKVAFVPLPYAPCPMPTCPLALSEVEGMPYLQVSVGCRIKLSLQIWLH